MADLIVSGMQIAKNKTMLEKYAELVDVMLESLLENSGRSVTVKQLPSGIHDAALTVWYFIYRKPYIWSKLSIFSAKPFHKSSPSIKRRLYCPT